MIDGQTLQREYYRTTAASYDEGHAEPEHEVALAAVASLARALDVRTVLDTGCGTGRAMRLLGDALPDVDFSGNDPSPDLLRVAVERHGIRADSLRCAASERLPYPDGSFDAVVATAVLHHVPDPAPVVDEMLRVARRLVCISDSNIYGQGALAARLVKYGLARAGMLRAANRLRRGGHDWFASDGDGIAYSYSVFDSLPALERACERVGVVPTTPEATSTHPLRAGRHCLVYGIKRAEEAR